MNVRNTDIAIWIRNKYQNNIIPRIPEYITSYLLDNPNKINLYFNKDIKLNTMLDFIALEYKKNPNVKTIDLIIKYVEHTDVS